MTLAAEVDSIGLGSFFPPSRRARCQPVGQPDRGGFAASAQARRAHLRALPGSDEARAHGRRPSRAAREPQPSRARLESFRDPRSSRSAATRAMVKPAAMKSMRRRSPKIVARNNFGATHRVAGPRAGDGLFDARGRFVNAAGSRRNDRSGGLLDGGAIGRRRTPSLLSERSGPAPAPVARPVAGPPPRAGQWRARRASSDVADAGARR